MQPTTRTIRLLCVTSAQTDADRLTARFGAEDWPAEVTVEPSVQKAVSHLETEHVDCILCTDGDHEEQLPTIRTLTNEFPSVPVVAFVDGGASERVDEILAAGATEILQGSPEDVSQTLVRRRIENVVDGGLSARDRALERYETILNTAGDAIYQLDTDGTIVAVNDAAVELTGYDRTELVGRDTSLVMPAEDIERVERRIAEALSSDTDEVLTLEMTIQTKDGEEIPCETRISVFRDDGEFDGTVGVVRDVSNQRERERKLRERDEMLEQISENITDVVWITDPDKSEMEFVSAAYEDVWGRSKDDLYENPQAFVEGVHPEDRDRVAEALEEQKADPDSYDEIYRVVQPDGEVRWVHDRAFGVYEDGDLQRMVGVARDITERREAKQELEAERDMFAEGPAVVFKWRNEAGWPVEYASENVEDVLGHTSDQFESGEVTYEEVIYDDDLERVTREVEENSDAATERFSHEPYRVVRPDGEVRWVRDTTKILREDGEITHYLGYIVDVTERKERERELEALKEEYEMMVETVGDVVYTLDDDYYFMSVNGAAEDVTGYTCEELEGAHLSLLLSEEGIQRGLERRRKVIEGEVETGSIELDVHRKGGGVTPVEFRYRELPSEDDEFRGTAGVVRDITERKRRERQLQAQRDLVERILGTSPVGILVVAADGEVVKTNDRAAEILGVDQATLQARPFDEHDWQVVDEDGEPVPPEEFPGTTVFETGEPVYGWEAKLVREGGERVWLSISVAPMVDDDGEVSEAVMTIEDVTERREREAKIERQRDELAQLDRLNAVIRDVDQALVGATSRDDIEQAVCDRLTATGRYQFALFLHHETDGQLTATAWTDAADEYVEGAFPVDAAAAEQSPGLQALETGEVQAVDDIVDEGRPGPPDARETVDIKSVAAVPVTYDTYEYGVVAVYADERGAFAERELDVLGELGDTIGHAIAAVERREREQTLTSLYEATRALLGTDTEREVSEVVVDVAEDVLDLPGVGVFLFDDEENVLEPEAATDTLLDFYGGTTSFGPGHAESEVWHTYATGDQQVFDDIRESERLANPDTDARSALLIPLGDHGVFVAASVEIGVFDEQKRQLIGLLAATTEAALDRVAGQAGIRERDEELEARARRLERLQRVTDVLRDVADEVVHAASRDDIEQAVCDRLVAEDAYDFAWIGAAPPGDSEVEPQTWAGSVGEYLDDVSFTAASDEPAARTARTGEATVVGNVTDHLRESPWARTAVEYDYESVVAIPLVYGETTYGILTVYADGAGAFDETTRTVLTELGELVAYGINVVETKQGILAERVTELELRIGTPDTFLNAVADLTDDTVQYREIAPAAGSDARVLFELADPPVGEILALEDDFVAVESLSHVERGDRHLFRARLGGDTVAGTLLECGGLPHSVVASGDETRAVVRLPQQLDVREFLDRVRGAYPDTELVSRRDVDSEPDSRIVGDVLDQRLTDRQREVLVTAFESGFFESPRETTGAELADLLGISQPTVTHHLREAQRRLFTELLGDDSR